MQKVILHVTKKPIRFKRFHPGGNLICLNADMEVAQVQGACDSFGATIDTEYSGITTRDADILATYFVRICYSHIKRYVNSHLIPLHNAYWFTNSPIHAFKSLVTPTELQSMMEFPYMASNEQIEAFSAWCLASPHEKIHGKRISPFTYWFSAYNLIFPNFRLVGSQTQACLDSSRDSTLPHEY